MQRIVLGLLFCALVVGCSDTTKYQSEFRGTWFLDSRKLSPGETIEAPKISGLIEWFPTTENQAQVHLSVTDDKQSIRIVDTRYDMNGSNFTYETNLRVGSVSTEDTDASYETTKKKGSGQISSDDARVTLNHDNGTRFEFIGAQLTITYHNGTVDSWKRNKDQKGVLAK